MDRKAHKVMTPEEYAATPLLGWHEVCRDVDGAGGVGVRYLGDAERMGSASVSSVTKVSKDDSPTCNTCGKRFSRSNISATSPTCESCLGDMLEQYPFAHGVRRR